MSLQGSTVLKKEYVASLINSKKNKVESFDYTAKSLTPYMAVADEIVLKRTISEKRTNMRLRGNI